MSHLARRGLLIAGLVLLSLLLGAATLNQTVPECPQGEMPTGCAQVTLNPSEATGDFYVDGILAASAQNPGWLVLTPDIEHTVEVKNIQSTEENFGTHFNYSAVTATVKVKAGETKVKTIRLTKTYIRGMLKFTCNVRNAAPTDAVSCRVTIDSVVQPDVAAGQAASYILDPGSRLVLVEIVGDPANLFDPHSKEQTVKIFAGSWATNLRMTFTKKGHLFMKLDQDGVVADFYLDGAQVATRVAAYDLWVAPYKSHKAEARNFTDPAAAGVYTWRNATQYAYLRPGTDKIVTFRLSKQYIKGFLVLKCNVTNMPGTYCVPTINGVGQSGITVGTSAQYTLDPGSYNVVVIPGPGGTWNPPSITRTVRVYAGITQTVSATFTAIQPTPVPQPVCDCSGNIYNCKDFSGHAQAQACFNYCMATVGWDVHDLDRDNDGLACEWW